MLHPVSGCRGRETLEDENLALAKDGRYGAAGGMSVFPPSR